MRVIGTAGHVDHGKSTLVQALTGTHPDRLKEEREREMTIDLGFAWLTLPKSEFLPEGEEVGIVDVPGHRDFIENMLSGVGGIDAALLVIAADEGVMPQTREHLSILDILQIGGGVVALTKVDLIEDREWLDLVEEDVRKQLSSTVLANAPIVRVSSRTREGLPELLQSLGACLAEQPLRPDLGRPRLPIDRVFTMAGFGTVVTGTLVDGHLKVGDEIQILSSELGSNQGDLRGRIRGLQTHKRKEDLAVPGSRTAVNISGIDLQHVHRGDVIVHPGDYPLTHLLDVRFRLLRDVIQPLEHNTEVKFFIGATEVVARVRLLGVEQLLPGQETWLQLELAEPVVAMRNDRYILRRPSPGETLGGGVVVDPRPKRRHKRFSEETLTQLESLTKGLPTEVLLQASMVLGAAPFQEVVTRANLDPVTARQAAQELALAGQLLPIEFDEGEHDFTPQELVTNRAYWEKLISRVKEIVDSYHQAFPLRRGVLREELKSRLKLSSRLFNACSRKWLQMGLLEENGLYLLKLGHEIRFTPQQQRSIDGLLSRFAAAPFAPPSIKECQAEVGEELYSALLETGELIAVSPDVVFRRKDFEKMGEELRKILERQGTITAAEVRDFFNTSRRYVLAFLEYLDSKGVTVRDGDVRRLKK
jgi:selenocysteine-specific elongation factor